ncbi:MAG: polysaccharide lyase, partial [Firmicutes bacterium]|nr:polysaccharide lyase [Bacillota bacterium]
MKKTKTKLVSGILTLSMLVSGFSCFYTPVYAASMTAGGWYETIYADITGVKDADVTAVSYTGEMSGTLTGEDFEYLVRDGENGVRIDIPGLKAGDYTLKVTAGGTEYTQNVTVMEYDRSGYAHFNYTSGVGAYNDDGTLKTGAKVLYVTNENKDTVSVTSSDGTTVAGIGNILNSRGGKINKDDKGKILSEVINTNSDIILKLSQDGTPLVVRFIGDVKAPEGLTAYDSYDYGGTEGDNGFMARMLSGKDVTLEGIGYDAMIDGWGVHYICESAHPEFGKSFEVRNLDFYGSPEDSVGMEGQQKNNAISAGVEHCWIHNNTFEPQKQAQFAESDKDEGDGSCDFKRGMYMTMSYNKFINAHKTCLVGSSDSSLQFNITWHHNYFYKNESRAPLGRQANMHIYNNYFYNQTDKTMDARANCYIFSEYNQLEY